jgi:hypothetical protein
LQELSRKGACVLQDAIRRFARIKAAQALSQIQDILFRDVWQGHDTFSSFSI